MGYRTSGWKHNRWHRTGVQNMIIQERYDRMDWLTYGAEQKAKGEDKLAALISQLFALGRSADAKKAANDASFRAQLFKEFNMLD